jgi:hypothetical protein
MLASIWYSSDRKRPMVRAFVGDSTITSLLTKLTCDHYRCFSDLGVGIAAAVLPTARSHATGYHYVGVLASPFLEVLSGFFLTRHNLSITNLVQIANVQPRGDVP